MIERLKEKNAIDIYDLFLRVGDKTNDFFITKDQKRIYINSLKLIDKILKYNEVYGLFEKELKGIFIVIREKNYRPYLKFLVDNRETARNLIKFVLWNYQEELFIKLNKENILIDKTEFRRQGKLSVIYYSLLKSKVWKFQGDRGAEILFHKEKFIKKEDKNDNRHYSKD